MQKYIVTIIVVSSFFLAGLAIGAEQPKPAQGIAAYTDRELALEFENLQLKVQQWGQAITEAKARLVEIQAEAKRRTEAAKKAADKKEVKP